MLDLYLGHGIMLPKNSYKDLPGPKSENPNVLKEQPFINISAFLDDLPVELRLFIYPDVFQDHMYHLVRLSVNRNIEPLPISHHRGHIMTPDRIILADHTIFPRRLEGPEPPSSFINLPLVEHCRERRTKWALLLTCRQIYAEAVQIFYETSTLGLYDPQILLDLATEYLSKRRLQALRRLEII